MNNKVQVKLLKLCKMAAEQLVILAQDADEAGFPARSENAIALSNKLLIAIQEAKS